MSKLIEIDGSYGEGGGQVLRTSLALSLVTGKPFRIVRIRAGRSKPGLGHQHLASVKAAAAVGEADVRGDCLGSQELYFAPRSVQPGRYHFDVGTAGSCTLVLQTVLPALLTVKSTSELVLEGGTHNPFAPPFEFLAETFLPIVNRMGPRVTVTLERYGFYPAGGGKINVTVEPAASLSTIELMERGMIISRSVRAIVARLPRHIGERELKVVREKLSWEQSCLYIVEVKNSRGPGNALIIQIASENITEIFTSFGRRGVLAEEVADQAVLQAQEYLDATVPVGKHLADQLLIPLALSGGGSFRTLPLSLHGTTNLHVLKHFLDIEAVVAKVADRVHEVHLRRRS
jgi:RNA 3'-terminal phosphate cyclase (ATP)